MAKTSKAKAKRRKAEVSDPAWWSLGSELPAWQAHAVAVAALVAVSVGFFAPIHFSQNSLVGGDTVNWRATAEAMIEYEQSSGEPALWSPNVFGGMPGYMIHYPRSVVQIDEVFRALRRFAWPSSHLILLLLGTYVLVFLLTADRVSSVLAACAYGLTTYIPVILVAGHNTKFVALAYAPWLVASFVYVLRKPGLLGGLLFAVVAATNLRAGHVQITYYFSFLIAIWWLASGISSFRTGETRSFVIATAYLALGSVLALLMVADPYLVIDEYKNYTIRSAGSGGGLAWDYAMAWSQGPGELYTLLVADAFGGASPTYWGPKSFTGGPHYVGAVVVACAIGGIVTAWRRCTGLLVATVLMILFSLGANLPMVNRPMFDFFPLFSSFRVPETWLAAVAFCVSVLAGIGSANLFRSISDTPSSRRSLYVFGGVLLFIGTIWFGKDALFTFEKPGQYEQVVQQIAAANNVSPSDPRVLDAATRSLAAIEGERAGLFAADSRRSIIALTLALLIAAAFTRRMAPGWLARGLIALLVLVDLWGVGTRHVNSERLVPATDVAETIPQYDFDTFVLDRAAESGGSGHFRVLSLEGDPTTAARPSFYYESLGGYHGAKLKRYQEFLDKLLFDPATGMPRQSALTMMNVKYVASPRPIAGMTEVFRGDQTGFAVYENNQFLPRAWFADSLVVRPDDESQIEVLQSGWFDPAHVVVASEMLPTVSPSDSTSVNLVRHSPREIEWDVWTERQGLMTIAEIDYPAGWTATVDDAVVPIHRVDFLLRAVVVDQGPHRVRLRFDPGRASFGVWISGLATALTYGTLLILLVVRIFRARKRSVATVGRAADE